LADLTRLQKNDDVSTYSTHTYTIRSTTGIDKEQAEREVDEYLKDKDAYIAKARAEEAKQAKKK
jgi:hypothetical protein